MSEDGNRLEELRQELKSVVAELARQKARVDAAYEAYESARSEAWRLKRLKEELEADIRDEVDSGQPIVRVGDGAMARYVRHSEGWNSIWLRMPGESQETRFRAVRYPRGAFRCRGVGYVFAEEVAKLQAALSKRESV